MICAEDELGIGKNHAGIMVLNPDAIPGTPAKDYLNLKTDVVYEIGLTPNRVDAASHIGVARDLSAYLRLYNMGGEMTLPSVEKFESIDKKFPGAIEVEIKSGNAAPRYSGITIKNITVKESPEWLRTKLLSVGLRPINNIVDITNFILMEMGQPLHAFDADKIDGGKVVVDFCKEGTSFVTLDGIERKLSDKDLMICNANEPMCIAGVFGGQKSGVTEETKSVFIESAYFNPIFIRKTSKRHGLKTDASFRYERGCDPMITMYALKRAVLLIQELAGGEVYGEPYDIISEKIEKKVVDLNYARMEALIGKKIGSDTLFNILKYLDMEFVKSDSQGATVKVPTYRVDVYRECDVVEDVLRIYGYNNIELPREMRVSINSVQRPEPERVKVLVSEYLAANGFMEIMNNSLTRSDYYSKLKTYPLDKCVMILNPLSSDLNCMRQTLLLGGLEVVAYNINRQNQDMRLFEIGNVYSYNKEALEYIDNRNSCSKENAELRAFSEEMKLSMFITGNGYQGWRGKMEGGNFFILKGYLETLLKKLGIDINSLEYAEAPSDIFSEGFSYMMNGKELAVMGTISPILSRKFGIKQTVFAAEISWKQILKAVKKNTVVYKELPKYPEVRRDLALMLDESVTFSEIMKAAYSTERKLLKSVNLFDVYVGDKIGEGKKQYAISFILQDPDKTLTDKAVEVIMNKLLKTFREKFGAELRG
jgi:phenylalanyl-tRNA synthetase, beta subunit, non-spirochete bacterial